MNDMFSFEPTALELLVENTPAGGTLSAIRLLSAADGEDETALLDALDALMEKRVELDVSQLPADFGSGELENRLRREELLVRENSLPCSLEESDPLRLYLEELAGIPVQGDSNLLACQMLAGEEGAAEKLMNLNLSRAVEAAYSCTGRGVLLLDLIQEASLGLWVGVSGFRGGDLEEHLDRCIRFALARVVILQARENGIMRTVSDSVERYQNADKLLLTRLGRNATLEEIALEMGVTPLQAELARDTFIAAREMQALKQPQQPQEPEEDQAVEDTAYFQSRQRIQELLSMLTEQEAKLLSLRFGLEGGVPATAQTVAEKLGMTAEQVVQMEASALAKLRR